MVDLTLLVSTVGELTVVDLTLLDRTVLDSIVVDLTVLQINTREIVLGDQGSLGMLVRRSDPTLCICFDTGFDHVC